MNTVWTTGQAYTSGRLNELIPKAIELAVNPPSASGNKKGAAVGRSDVEDPAGPKEEAGAQEVEPAVTLKDRITFKGDLALGALQPPDAKEALPICIQMVVAE